MSGPRHWRSLAEREGARPSPNEFPPGAAEIDGSTRRAFMELIAASMGAAALAGCTRSPAQVRPYTRPPADVKPGIALHYATTLTMSGLGTGVLVTSREGRPVKVEGNPSHPASLGATGIQEQAAIYQLFDPQRARTGRREARPSAWSELVAFLARPDASFRRDGGAGLRFLVEPTASPLLESLRADIAKELPNARFHAFDPLARDVVYEGTKLAFGRALEPRLDFDRARVVVALDADFLFDGPLRVRHQRDFAEHRVPENGMSRLYVAESALTVTGANADHRLRARSAEIVAIALALLAAVAPDRAPAGSGPASFASHPWVVAAAKDLRAQASAALVVAGPRQPAAVHAIVAALNAALGTGAVTYTRPALLDTGCGPSSLVALAADIAANRVDTLVITAWNPAYCAPADLGFPELLARVPTTIYHGLFDDETARRASWFVPAAHELESWGDARSADGTISFVQPLVEPLHGGVQVAELFAAFVGRSERGALGLLRDAWATRAARPDFDGWWDATLQAGVVPGSAFALEQAEIDAASLARVVVGSGSPSGEGLEIGFRPDARIRDGRFANCAWLQELPDPMTKLTWSNALEISPRTAERLGLATEDRVEIQVGDRRATATVMVVPGHADEAGSITLGYGRAGAEVIARELGTDAYKLRTIHAPWFASGASLKKLPGKRPLAVTQEHWSTEGRPVALDVTADDVARRHLPVVASQTGAQPTMYTPVAYDGYRWAMAIDTTRCTGCSACIIACESENNILPVGEEQVRRGREMQWLRIDRYFEGDLHDPRVAMQPLACVHCENAPCEVVCPVNATVHSDEGLNEMVYNRCVGTRYCSNNCPYKVRRFNFLDYHGAIDGSLQAAMSPEVTVRGRGVMEKCSYCVQRIEAARITAEIGGRPVGDGEIVTACQQVCPSKAITFGSLHDPAARVTRLHEDPRAWSMLHELGTRPRTVHLARVRNPNPELG